MEQHDIKEQLDQVATTLAPTAKQQLQENGHFDPVVVLIYPENRREFLYPRFQNEDEKLEAFSKVNRHIKDTGALGAVLVLETLFFRKGTSDKQEALLLMKRGQGINEYEAWVYEWTDDELRWKDHLGPGPKRSDMLITAFKEMH